MHYVFSSIFIHIHMNIRAKLLIISSRWRNLFQSGKGKYIYINRFPLHLFALLFPPTFSISI